MVDVTRREPGTRLFGMGVLVLGGALGVVTGVAGATIVVVDPLVVTYAIFAVGFTAGAAHHARVERHVAAAAHGVAVVGWTTGIVGQTIADPAVVAFSLGTLGASGLALFFAGLQSVGLLDGSV
ncbi:MAG: hypothetical protein ACI9YT_003037 [Halobacteriales archaeon]|jgi:hypothetical protein